MNDLNKETEYQENKNQREITYIKKQLMVFILTTLLFALLGLVLLLLVDFTNVGIIYYLILSVFSMVILSLIPYLKLYISRVLFAYTIVVIACYTVYTSESASLQPCGLIFVLAFVAGLNHSYVYPTISMIALSVIMFIIFSFVSESYEEIDTTVSSYRSGMWVLVGSCWAIYVYF